MSAGFVPLDQSTNQSELTICYDTVCETGVDIQKSIKWPNKAIYNWILQHAHVVQSQIENYSLV